MKSSSLFSCFFGTIVAAVCSTGGLNAQNVIAFDTVTATPTDLAGYVNDFNVVLGGTTVTNANYPGFNVHVGSGTGTGAALVGQSYLALCVNISYPDPISNLPYNLAPDASVLSYDIDGAGGSFGDSWATANAANKYAAIRDIVATFGGTLTGLDQSSLEFQQRVVAMTFAFAEIVVDYDNTVGSLGIATGNARFFEQDGSPISSAVATYYQQALDAIGNGSGNSYTLYAAGIPEFSNQDVILIPIPEPSGIVLLGAAGLLVLGRRRRI